MGTGDCIWNLSKVPFPAKADKSSDKHRLRLLWWSWAGLSRSIASLNLGLWCRIRAPRKNISKAGSILMSVRIQYYVSLSSANRQTHLLESFCPSLKLPHTASHYLLVRYPRRRSSTGKGCSMASKYLYSFDSVIRNFLKPCLDRLTWNDQLKGKICRQTADHVELDRRAWSAICTYTHYEVRLRVGAVEAPHHARDKGSVLTSLHKYR